VFLALHPVVMVQQARLVGAGPAVARVELAWLVVVLDQHGHSSSMYLAGTLRARLDGGITQRWEPGVGNSPVTLRPETADGAVGGVQHLYNEAAVRE
jgi:hypothetical protein